MAVASQSVSAPAAWPRGSRKVIAPVAFTIAFFVVWEVWLHYLPMSRAVITPPSAIYATLVANHELLLGHMLATMQEIVLGFLLAAAFGISLGTVITMSTWVRQAFYPNIVFFQLIPKVAVAPLFVVWLGFGSPSRLAFAVFMAFFPVAVATAAGLVNTKLDAVRLCRSLTASQWQIFTAVRLPFAIPHIFAGLKVGMTMAMIGIIVGEFITGQQGLGYVIMFASSAGESAPLYAALLLLATLGLVLYSCVLLAEIAAQRWYGAPFASEGFA
jgi:NitT/TauT family transport system permease protein